MKKMITLCTVLFCSTVFALENSHSNRVKNNNRYVEDAVPVTSPECCQTTYVACIACTLCCGYCCALGSTMPPEISKRPLEKPFKRSKME